MEKINKKDLIKRIEDMLFYEDSLSEEDKNRYENIFSHMPDNIKKEFILNSKQNLIVNYTGTITRWYMYLRFFEDREEFEYCHKIMRIINIEEREFKKIFFKYKCKDEKCINFYSEVIPDVKSLVKQEVYSIKTND